MHKQKWGIKMLALVKLIGDFNFQLIEDEKKLIQEYFQLRINTEYLDIEQLYNVFETLMIEKNFVKAACFEEGSLSQLWEQSIYQKIGNYFKEHNLSIERAFQLID